MYQSSGPSACHIVLWPILIIAALLPLIASTKGIVAVQNDPPSQSAQGQNMHFDSLVREDFFAGLAGDEEAFKRAMKLCEDALAHNPQNPAALVWHGAGVYFRGGRTISSGERQKGKEMIIKGTREMDDAVALQSSVETLVPRASVLLVGATRTQAKEYREPALKKSVADFEQVLRLQAGDFDRRCLHARGELLGALAEGWYRLGEKEKATQYLLRMNDELSGSIYAVAASRVSRTPPDQENVHLTCLGCHTNK